MKRALPVHALTAFLLAALGACKSMTMRLYANRKSLPLERAKILRRIAEILRGDAAEDVAVIHDPTSLKS